MTHKGTVTLETERLVLRRFVKTDIEDVFNNWGSDPEAAKYLWSPPHKDIAVTREYNKERLRNYKRDNYYNWAIELKATGQVIGNISAFNLREGIQSVEVGSVMGKAWWNQGYMTEALCRLVKFLFEEVGANRIESNHDPRNPGSGRVLQKAGMTYEGTLRQAGSNNRGVCDQACYAILANEYG